MSCSTRSAAQASSPAIASSLRWAGWFDGLAGLLVGRSSGPDGKGPEDLFQDAVLRRAFADAPFPVLVDVDIGHLPPQLVLVNGARAEVHWSAADGGSVVQHLD